MSESGAGAIPVAAAFDMKQLRATIRNEMRELLNEVRDERRLAAEERKADMAGVRDVLGKIQLNQAAICQATKAQCKY